MPWPDLTFQLTKAVTDNLLSILSQSSCNYYFNKVKKGHYCLKYLKCKSSTSNNRQKAGLLTSIFRLNSHPRYFPTDVANTPTTVQPRNRDPLGHVSQCVRGVLRLSVIEVSGEIDTRPWVAVRETGSANLQVCPLGEGQSDSGSVNSTLRHKANPLMDSFITKHFVCWLTTFCHQDTMVEITSVSLHPTIH